MKHLVLTLTIGLLTLSSARADVTLTINNKDFPSGSSCKGSGTTVVKMTEGKNYNLKLTSDCSVVVEKIK